MNKPKPNRKYKREKNLREKVRDAYLAMRAVVDKEASVDDKILAATNL